MVAGGSPRSRDIGDDVLTAQYAAANVRYQRRNFSGVKGGGVRLRYYALCSQV